MATVYSLICWGGRTGKTVSISASTDVVTLTNHGLRDGTKLWPSGTLPAELSVLVPVYARSTAANTFTLHTSAAGATANTDQILFAGSSTYAAVVLKSDLIASMGHSALAPYGLSDLSRWGSSEAERIYDGLINWKASRGSASNLDAEIAEIGDAFTEATQTQLNLNIPSATKTAISTINGIRTPAFHSGIVGAGFVFDCTYGSYQAILMSSYFSIVDGFTATTGAVNGGGVNLTTVGSEVRNMIIRNTVTATGGTGVIITSASASKLLNCLIMGFYVGIEQNAYVYANIVGNNTIVKCPSRGFYTTNGTTASVLSYYYNNISVGNGINWNSMPTSAFDGASHNVGVTGDTPWVKSGGSTVAVGADWNGATPLFMDYANNDFRPYSSGGVLNANSTLIVDSGLGYYGLPTDDLAGDERPNYNNGGAESTDIGSYEYDHGYGPHPNTAPIGISGMVDGSRLLISRQSDGSEIYNDIPGASYSNPAFDLSANTPVYLRLRKGSEADYYHPTRVSATIDMTNGLTYSFDGLQIEDIAAAPYAPTVTSDWTLNWTTGAIAHMSGTTRYSVQDLYSYHQDDSDTAPNMDATPMMHGTTPNIFEMINSGTISNGDLEDLYGGSIEFQDGTLWSNLWTAGTLTGNPTIYVVQGGARYPAFWGSGNIDVLLKVSDAGAVINNGNIAVVVRHWGFTYDDYILNLAAGGRNVAPLSTALDINILETEAVVGGWSDMTTIFGTVVKDFGDSYGPQTYAVVVNCNSRPLSEAYQRMQYITREGSTEVVNGVPGWMYQSADPTYDIVKSAPFGVYSGGLWVLAKGVWLDNVAPSDSINYILTDDAGNTHQNTVALNQSVTVSGVVVGSRVRIYDETNSLELVNSIATSTSVYWEDPSTPVGDRTIHLRVSYVSGVTAKEFVEANIGTCGTSQSTKDVSYLVSQKDDIVYNSNGIDGSTVAGVTFTDSSVDKMNINVATGNTTLGALYAAWVSYAFTAEGIATDIEYIDALDVANYVYSNLLWKNTTSPTMPLKITGGYATDAVTGDPISLVDTTGGTIFLAPPHVVTTVVTVTGGNVITGDISTVLAGIDGVPGAVLAAADATPISANIEQVNGVTVDGTGVTGDEWGPV